MSLQPVGVQRLAPWWAASAMRRPGPGRRAAGGLAILVVLAALWGMGSLVVLAGPSNPAASTVSYQVPQGGLLVVRVETPASQVSGLFLGQQVPFYPVPDAETGASVALFAVSYHVEPGEYLLSLAVDGRREQRRVRVLAREFPVQRLTVSPALEQKTAPTEPALVERQRREAAEVAAAKAKSSERPLWSGTFLWPVRGRITSEFGLRREVNGRITSRHSGLDIASPTGTPVLASNDGVVTLAREHLTTGNTVIIDHGWGLSTSYLHLDRILVQEGQQVKRGEVIGTVGSTGFATGPHLHWAASAFGGFIDPRVLVEEPPSW